MRGEWIIVDEKGEEITRAATKETAHLIARAHRQIGIAAEAHRV